jgi:hypothetical protein
LRVFRNLELAKDIFMTPQLKISGVFSTASNGIVECE